MLKTQPTNTLKLLEINRMLQGVFTSFEFEFGFQNLTALLIKFQNNTAKKPPWSQPKKTQSTNTYLIQEFIEENKQEQLTQILKIALLQPW